MYTSEEEKIYAKISTPNSLNSVEPSVIEFAEDGLRSGTTNFRLEVKSITGEGKEALFSVTVTNDWHTLSISETH